MPIYHKLGKIPSKRHTIFEKPGGGLYYEQLFGTIGFDGMSSLLYHLHRPHHGQGHSGAGGCVTQNCRGKKHDGPQAHRV